MCVVEMSVIVFLWVDTFAKNYHGHAFTRNSDNEVLGDGA